MDHLNLAKTLRDGQKIIIKSKEFTSDKLNINLATKRINRVTWNRQDISK